MFARHKMYNLCLVVGFQGQILFMTVLWSFRVESCVWLCRQFSGSNLASGCAVDFQAPNVILSFGPAPKCNTMVCTIWALILGLVPNIVQWFVSTPIITLSLGPVSNVILCSGVGYHLYRYCLGTVLNATISWYSTIVTISRSPIPNASTSANTCCTKCNNNDWSYLGNSAKCGSIVVTVLLL